MRGRASSAIGFGLVLLSQSMLLVDFAHAGTPTPGPIAGLGLPVLGAAAGVFWLVRKVRDRNRAP
jgi:hypothetical protein